MLLNQLKNGEVNLEEVNVEVESELAKQNAKLEVLPPVIIDPHQYASTFGDSPPLPEFDLGPSEAEAPPLATDIPKIPTPSPSLHEVAFN